MYELQRRTLETQNRIFEFILKYGIVSRVEIVAHFNDIHEKQITYALRRLIDTDRILSGCSFEDMRTKRYKIK